MDDVIDSSPDTYDIYTYIYMSFRMHATTQCKLEHVHAVYAQVHVLLGKRPLAIVPVAEGNHHKCRYRK